MRKTFHRRWLALALLCPWAGCAGSHGDVDLLEARLRDQQDLSARYERMLGDERRELAAARRESDLLRGQLAHLDVPPLLPEHADVLLRAEKLEFHSLMTGARNADGQPGDDVLNVVLMPEAGSGEVIRLVGAIEIEALDLSRPAGEQQIGQWSFTPEQARDNWHSGFLASGFQFELPWQEASSEVVLHARLIAPDGRQFDASYQMHAAPQMVRAARPTPPDMASPLQAPPQRAPGAVVSTERPLAPASTPLTEAPAFPAAPELIEAEASSSPPVAAAPVSAPQEYPRSGPRPAANPPLPAPRRIQRVSTQSPAPIASAEFSPPVEMPVVQPLPERDRPPEHDRPVPRAPDGLSIPIPAPQEIPAAMDEASAAPPTAAEMTILPNSPQRFRRSTPQMSAGGPALSSPPSIGSSQIDASATGYGSVPNSPPPFPATLPGSNPAFTSDPASRPAAAAGPAIQTSDRWTDESIPYLR